MAVWLGGENNGTYATLVFVRVTCANIIHVYHWGWTCSGIHATLVCLAWVRACIAIVYFNSTLYFRSTVHIHLLHWRSGDKIAPKTDSKDAVFSSVHSYWHSYTISMQTTNILPINFQTVQDYGIKTSFYYSELWNFKNKIPFIYICPSDSSADAFCFFTTILNLKT